jgi:hypothetical protein
MTYENDPLLPMLQAEVNSRISHFKGLTPQEEGKMLSLNADQKKIIRDNDKK